MSLPKSCLALLILTLPCWSCRARNSESFTSKSKAEASNSADFDCVDRSVDEDYYFRVGDRIDEDITPEALLSLIVADATTASVGLCKPTNGYLWIKNLSAENFSEQGCLGFRVTVAADDNLNKLQKSVEIGAINPVIEVREDDGVTIMGRIPLCVKQQSILPAPSIGVRN